ncbi:hypothetical protein O3M35_007725 [Rhynocoris fuscipes]|uniref:Uncharacterized protein n=1 Tax=Rhynocoris fuscipes TaxID=488301 RepID=A0AAW1DE05_9HEMI
MSLGIILAKLTLWGVGGIMLVFCGVMCGFWPVILNYQLKKELILTNSSKSYNLWIETPIPMYLEIYMFNWTNPSETLQGSAKPNFLQLGPYVFSEKHKKENLIWNTNDTITFKQRRTWHFVPEMSKGTLSDKITNLNVIAMTVGNKISNYIKKIPPRFIPTIFAIINQILKIEESDVFVTKSVNELLFDGYDDKFLTIAKKLEKILKYKLPFDKFGWFYNRNNSIDYDGTFNMKTGALGLDQLGDIVRWNYSPQSPSYPGHCGDIDGSSGELWPIDAASRKSVKIFANDICSSLILKQDGTSAMYGVKGSRFSADKNVFDNGENIPDNSCYCTKKPCPATGARDISKCRYGAPAFISSPHFYMADSSYVANISGMSPNPDLHNFFILLEEITSIPLKVQARLQINIRSEPIKGIKFYENLPYAYMPMIWFDQTASVTPDLANELSSLVGIASYVEPSLIGLTVVGAVMIIIGLILWRLDYFTKNQEEPLIEPSTS